MNKPATTPALTTPPQAAAAPQEPQAGGSYRRNADGSITCLQRTDPGPHDGRRRLRPDPEPAQSTPIAPAHQE